jgi:hypothetical protein
MRLASSYGHFVFSLTFLTTTGTVLVPILRLMGMRLGRSAGGGAAVGGAAEGGAAVGGLAVGGDFLPGLTFGSTTPSRRSEHQKIFVAKNIKEL